MPLRTEHIKEGMLLREGSWIILQRDDGGRWRLALDAGDERLLGRRVRVHGRAPASTSSTCGGLALLTDWELWAVANFVLEQHGDEAPMFVAARIGALALEGDDAGIAAWREVARRMTELRVPERKLDA